MQNTSTVHNIISHTKKCSSLQRQCKSGRW